MKNLKTLAIIGLLALTTIGCAAPVDEAAADREKALTNRVEELEQEITSLEKKKNTENTDNSTALDTVSDNASTGDITETVTLESLTNLVEAAVNKVDTTKPAGTTDEIQTTFFNIKHELDAIDNQIDSFDDYLESQLRQGLITRDEYRLQEAELEELEDKLDNAEDRLEISFGMDD